jgi:micrococcal nuclease
MPRGMPSKRAPRYGALFALLTLTPVWRWFALAALVVAVETAWPACNTDRLDALARTSFVYDGDTVEINGSERVRFIGINTPEVSHHDHPPEPYGVEASHQLRKLLRNAHEQVGLRYGTERRDKYGRLLAHVFLEDGTSVEEWLLERGLATTLAVPPNVWNLNCYSAAETRARLAKRGLWSLPQYQPVDSVDRQARTKGYRVIRGPVTRVGKSRKSIWLNLAGGVALRIDRHDLQYFRPLNLESLQGKTVLARGWVHLRKGEAHMRIRHPVALQVID